MKRVEFDKIVQDDADYSVLRGEIADTHFQGNSNFSIHDAINGAYPDGNFSGDAVDSDAGGGDSDGDAH